MTNCFDVHDPFKKTQPKLTSLSSVCILDADYDNTKEDWLKLQ